MDELLKTLILGLVQGITEFLPVSSTGHLIVTSTLLNFQNSLGGTFEIFIQLGSVLAVIIFYRADLLRQARLIGTDKNVQRLWLGIIIAAIPAAVMGFLLRDFIKTVLFSPAIVGVTLIIGGIIFLFLEREPAPENTPAPLADLSNITLRQALGVGIAQVFALIPGVSRSGASIVGGLLSGMNRPTATAFAFYLAIPVLGGATLLDLLLSLDEITGSDQIILLLVGLVVTMIVSLFAIGWLLRYVSRNSFRVFGYYRIVAGIVILALVAAGILS
ncbi:MAG: undecaprenyl-diphosphate phosphatase [Anaerolineae bacterium]|nr:undecaprenyl-diphosphate phosphatase [Anaerolineae bacterium]